MIKRRMQKPLSSQVKPITINREEVASYERSAISSKHSYTKTVSNTMPTLSFPAYLAIPSFSKNFQKIADLSEGGAG